MKVICDREKLLRAFQTVASVAPLRSPKPVLSNVKLVAQPDALVLMGTDLENGIRIELTGMQTVGDGQALLPIDRFGSILRESGDEKLDIEGDGKRVLVHGGQSKFQLPAEDPLQFPDVEPFAADDYYQLPAAFFRELIHRTAFATDNENSRYALGGVLIEFDAEELNGVATDGRRLARQVGAVQAVGRPDTAERTTIITTRAMQLIDRAISENDEQISIAVGDNKVVLRSGRTTIHASLNEGRFPNWRAVFPDQEQLTRIDVAVGMFHAAVRQAAIVTSSERRGVDFSFGDGKALLSGHGAELGESHIELPIAYDAAAITVKLDPRYVSDFLRVLQPEQTVTIGIRDAKTAAVFTTDDGYSYVVMPLERKES